MPPLAKFSAHMWHHCDFDILPFDLKISNLRALLQRSCKIGEIPTSSI